MILEIFQIFTICRAHREHLPWWEFLCHLKWLMSWSSIPSYHCILQILITFHLLYLRVKTSQSRPNRKDIPQNMVELSAKKSKMKVGSWNLERWPTTEIMISAPIVFLDRCFLKIGSSLALLAWQSIQKRLRVEGWMARPKPRALENEANDLDRWADRIVAFNFILRLTRDFIVAFIAWSKSV